MINRFDNRHASTKELIEAALFGVLFGLGFLPMVAPQIAHMDFGALSGPLGLVLALLLMVGGLAWVLAPIFFTYAANRIKYARGHSEQQDDILPVSMIFISLFAFVFGFVNNMSLIGVADVLLTIGTMIYFYWATKLKKQDPRQIGKPVMRGFAPAYDSPAFGQDQRDQADIF